jgi:hypothetical protein
MFGVIPGDAVTFLDLPDELFALPGNPVELIVGKLAPLLLQFPFRLLPIALDHIPIHTVSSDGLLRIFNK